MFTKPIIFFIIIVISGVVGCIEPSIINANQGIFSNANRLYEDYNWKLDSVKEIQNRTDALGIAATKDMYLEWKRRNNEAIEAGERLATYITENRNILNQFWTSDVLVLIAGNKVTFERDNQAIDQTIISLGQPKKPYTWEIYSWIINNGAYESLIEFENLGTDDLYDVRIKFDFYTSSGKFYTERKFEIGNVEAGKKIRKILKIPLRYSTSETWTIMKMNISINGSPYKEEPMESPEVARMQ